MARRYSSWFYLLCFFFFLAGLATSLPPLFPEIKGRRIHFKSLKEVCWRKSSMAEIFNTLLACLPISAEKIRKVLIAKTWNNPRKVEEFKLQPHNPNFRCSQQGSKRCYSNYSRWLRVDNHSFPSCFTSLSQSIASSYRGSSTIVFSTFVLQFGIPLTISWCTICYQILSTSTSHVLFYCKSV